MNLDFFQQIDNAVQQRDYLQLKRADLDYEDTYIDGIPLFREEGLLLVKFIHDDLVLFNGYSLILIHDVTELTVNPELSSFRLRALELKGQKPEFNEAKLKFKSFFDCFKFFEDTGFMPVIYREKLDNSMVNIGQVLGIQPDKIVLKEIGTEGAWEAETELLLSDVTRVDFGGEYEKALTLIANDKS